MTKTAIIGLDAVPPELMFTKLLDRLPNIKKMYLRGLFGNLTSCHPPITVPAWMVMMTGKNPGKLGIYGFRHRRGFTYNEGYIVNSTCVREESVWQSLAKQGKNRLYSECLRATLHHPLAIATSFLAFSRQAWTRSSPTLRS